MGKFDKYSGGQPLLPSGEDRGKKAPEGSKAAALIQNAQGRAPQQDAARLIYGETKNVAIALDATGSMAGLLSDAKHSIAEIIKRASEESKIEICIELFVYRDYDVPDQLMERSGLTSKPETLTAWLSRVSADGGGANEGEAIEVALSAILDDQKFSAILLAGDEPSNGPISISKAQRAAGTAHEIAKALGERKIPIHSFVVGNDPRTTADFARLSSATGGKSGRLDGSKEMIDLAVMAILASVRGTGGVRRYMEGRALSANSKAFGQLLLGDKK